MSSPNSNPSYEGLKIPELEVRLLKFDTATAGTPLQVFFKDQGDKTFLSLQPRIFFFMYRSERSGKRVVDQGVRTFKSAGFYHPVDADAATTHGNSSFYGGTARDAANNLVSKNTEWPLIVSGPYDKQRVDLNIYKYFRINGASTILQPSDFPMSPQGFVKTGMRSGNRSSKRKNIHFKLAIGVKNPKAKQGENPWIFGPMTKTMKAHPLAAVADTVAGFAIGFSDKVPPGM